MTVSDDGRIKLWSDKGQLLQEMGDRQTRYTDIDFHQGAEPSGNGYYYRRGQVYLKLNDREAAKHDFQMASSLAKP